MTPLAHKLVRQLTLPVKERFVADVANLKQRLSDTHCFDVTAVRPMMNDVGYMMGDLINQNAGDLSFMRERGFLPAPKTWIEWSVIENGRSVGRVGYLLEEVSGMCSVAEAIDLFERPSELTTMDALQFPLKDALKDSRFMDSVVFRFKDWPGDRDWHNVVVRLWAALTIINTPKLIGRITRIPHRGLERALQKKHAIIGKYPLHAWSEIVLSASPKFLDETGQEVEAYLTGRKCLHFCRAHLRIRRGQLELVSSHWRGDPALGIKRSRYRLVA